MVISLTAFASQSAKIVVLFCAYLLTAKIGLSLHPVNDFAALIWPPTGIAVAALFLYGYRLWPGVALGALFVNLMVGANPAAAAGIAVGNTLEALAGAYVLREMIYLQDPFVRIRDAVGFSIVALVVPVLSATIGVASLWLGGILGGDDLFITWIAWWTGDMLGAFILTPFLIQFLAHPPRFAFSLTVQFRRIAIRQLGFFALLVASSCLIFWTDLFLMPYVVLIPFVALVLAANPRYTSLGSVVLAAVAISGTLAGHGPFALYDEPISILLLQTFLGTSTIIFFVTSSALEERRCVLRILTAQNRELKNALQKLAIDDTTKNEFLATLSHELRNPLAPIMHSLDFIHLQAHTLSPSEIRRVVDTIGTHLRTVVRLLDDLLDISRITRKKITLRKEPVDMQSVVHQALQTVHPQYQTRNHSLTVSLPAHPCTVDADPIRLQQILVNILNNAARYTSDGGTIEVSMHYNKDRGCRLSVRDNGRGIEPELLDAIFEPFTQGSQEKGTDSSGGLGIGLALTKQLVELHGGRVWAESGGPGTGSEIIVVLPTSSFDVRV